MWVFLNYFLDVLCVWEEKFVLIEQISFIIYEK